MIEKFKDTKLFIGPMSRNVVDTVIEYSNANSAKFGLIPSRRQIEYDGGYVNNWTTAEFVLHVNSNQNGNIIIQRDHGGPDQGIAYDDGRQSFMHDAIYDFDLIHIDPWKKHKDIESAVAATVKSIQYCNTINSQCFYEVGTEQAIREYSAAEFEQILQQLQDNLGRLFDKIAYAVIQGGTSICETSNTGLYDRQKCSEMIEICEKYGVLSKEHNGDYLTASEIKDRFALGLNGINIAPEFGVLETKCILQEIKDTEMFEQFYSLCYNSDKWRKWLPEDFSLTEDNKEVIISVSGHYVFSNHEFRSLKQQLPGIDAKIQKDLIKKLDNLYGVL